MEDTSFGIYETLFLIGSLGFFIYGMKVMSEGIQKAAGQNLRKILGAMTKTRFLGVLTGFSVTSLVQSSSATTVMIVSFVNAGLLNLQQAVSVIMGANIGTTMTAVLITVFGLGKFKIAAYAIPVIAIAFPLLFAKKDNLKSIGEMLIGFALLFMGLDSLKHSVPELSAASMEFLASLNNYGALSTLIFIGVGTLLTVVVQSSSAAMALTLVLCESGIIQFDMAAAIVLGENIGTTITANLAALIGNVHAKRAARAHLIFNLVGVVWMFIVFTPFLNGIDYYMTSTGQASPFAEPSAVKWGLTVFHISFNIINTSLLIWFVPLLVKLSIKAVPSKGDDDEIFQLEYISTGMLSTPELSILEAKKEIFRFSKLVKKMHKIANELLLETDQKKIKKKIEKIEKYEDITDRMEVEVADYLRKVSEDGLTQDTSLLVRGMMGIVGDLEDMGDIYFKMAKVLDRKNKDKIYLLPEQRNNILNLMDEVDTAIEIMLTNLDKETKLVTVDEAREQENKINKLRNKLRKEHLSNLEKGEYNVKNGMVYADIISGYEEIGDHIINVTEALTGEV